MSDDAVKQQVCFVVMGFGKKTAYTKDHKPRVLDLDATYKAVIQPAVESQGFRCVRGDEMLNSGMIDTRMYEMLLRADLVIADISTGNINAVYELGVRHALRPLSTIIMQEDQAAFHFDLSHITTFVYRHLGEDIGSQEATKKSAALAELIRTLKETPTRDSPVYEYLKGLQEPVMSEEDYAEMLTVIEEKGDGLAQEIAKGKAAMKASDFAAAIEAFGNARAIITKKPEGDESAGQSDAEYVTQQLALATYKSKQPSEVKALEEGLEIIGTLNPDSSNDLETLGITGAIRKRLWLSEAQRPHLDKAVEYYERGFNLQRDYYNGENYAVCLEMRADEQADEDEAAYDRLTAKKTRKKIIELLTPLFESADIAERPDRVWMHATMANCLFALKHDEEAKVHEKKFKELADADWMSETYEEGKRAVLKQHA